MYTRNGDDFSGSISGEATYGKQQTLSIRILGLRVGAYRCQIIDLKVRVRDFPTLPRSERSRNQISHYLVWLQMSLLI